MSIGFKSKIVLYNLREVKCRHSYTPGICYDIANFLLKRMGGTEALFCYFCFLECFNCQWVRVVGRDIKSYLELDEIVSFYSWF